MNKVIVVVVILLLLPLCVVNSQDIYQEYIDIHNIPITINHDKNDNHIDTSIDIDSSINSDDFKDFIDFILLNMEVIAYNIVNANTTWTGTGGPFIKKHIKFVDGVMAIVEDHRIGTRLVYDPLHPDAIRNGLREGYVELPNVDIVSEIVDYISAFRFLQALLFKGLDMNIVEIVFCEKAFEEIKMLNRTIGIVSLNLMELIVDLLEK